MELKNNRIIVPSDIIKIDLSNLRDKPHKIQRRDLKELLLGGDRKVGGEGVGSGGG